MVIFCGGKTTGLGPWSSAKAPGGRSAKGTLALPGSGASPRIGRGPEVVDADRVGDLRDAEDAGAAVEAEDADDGADAAAVCARALGGSNSAAVSSAAVLAAQRNHVETERAISPAP